jgi:hypothetical protein
MADQSVAMFSSSRREIFLYLLAETNISRSARDADGQLRSGSIRVTGVQFLGDITAATGLSLSPNATVGVLGSFRPARFM